MNKILNAGTGIAGIMVSEAAGLIDPTKLSEIAKAVVQVLIAVATLWQLVKKKKPQS